MLHAWLWTKKIAVEIYTEYILDLDCLNVKKTAMK
jgi:hypothetical protein